MRDRRSWNSGGFFKCYQLFGIPPFKEIMSFLR
ncbi:hypothetical protein C812_02318 [Paenibacillus barengoltzii G22]|uniref:Uncharacterized protein n=1 Tax=Paenibacillus barengoltzii G22 TaxID=1235795 RepID=R9LCG4_9BACL|nr:hypothetical protein C812_02318 [Paenibacillus barengoltzii G22]